MNVIKGFTALLCSIICLSIQANVIKETEQTLSSPDGNYCFSFYQNAIDASKRQMYYKLTFKGKEVINESELGLLIENQLFESALGIPNDTCKQWCENLDFVGVERSARDTVWKPVYGEQSLIRDNYNTMVLRFRKGDHSGESTDLYDKRRFYYLDVEVRAYNEGVAFRYHFPATTNGLFIHITGEQTRFTLPEGTQAYYERWAQGPYSLLPLKGWSDECERPLTLKLANGLTVSLAEAGLTDYVRTKFRLDDQKENTLVASMYDCADIITPYNTPWRVIMAGERAVDLINNNSIILNLNDECKIADTSWIKPGKAFRSDLSQQEVMRAIDFASERNIQYVHIDAGWYGPEMLMSTDATTVAEGKDLDIEALCKYAASKSIGFWVYVNQRALIQQLDELLPLYKKWGIAGIKFGFVQIGNQHWTTWLHEAIKKCAEYQILVDIHDEYRPTGFSRTYPNLMTQEGICGNEEMPDATHNVTLPFTRFLSGAGDYTLCYFNSRQRCTHAHQLAMAAVYYSPIQFMFWYDKPSMYNGEAELEFWKNVKTVWDETRALQGEIGEYIVTARRSGKEWFVGAMTNTEARELSVTTDFLEKGTKYTLYLYEDDSTLDTRTKVRCTTRTIKGGERIALSLQKSGGAALHFVPAK